MGSMILLHNHRHKKDMSQKLAFKWLSPYLINLAVEKKVTYMLEELERLRLAGTFAGDCLKKFHPQQRFRLNCAPTLTKKWCQTLKIFLQ